jgi:hypothetical protein
MKVRFQGLPKDSASGERRSSPFLTVGQDYVVLAIKVSSAGPTKYLLIGDRKDDPSWFPAPQFDLVADEVPTTWKVLVGAGGSAGHIEIAPEPWLVRGFWGDYWGDTDPLACQQAHDVFARELDAILREVG